MKATRGSCLISVVTCALTCCYGGESPLLTEEQKVLYTLGITIAKSAHNFELSDSELELVKLGLSDGVLGRTLKVDPDEYVSKISGLATTRMDITRRKQLTIGEGFRKRMLSEAGAQSTHPGLIFFKLRPGQGPPLSLSDTVSFHVKGSLVDGSVFADSRKGKEPITLVVEKALPCWREGLLLMRAGEMGRLVCHPELTYRELNGPNGTKPGATLSFEIEVLRTGKR